MKVVGYEPEAPLPQRTIPSISLLIQLLVFSLCPQQTCPSEDRLRSNSLLSFIDELECLIDLFDFIWFVGVKTYNPLLRN